MLRFPIHLRPWRPLAPNSIFDASTFFRSPTCVSYGKNNCLCVFDRSANTLLLLLFRVILYRLSSEGPLCCPFCTMISNVSASGRVCYVSFRDRFITCFLLSFRRAFSNISPVYKENETFRICEKKNVNKNDLGSNGAVSTVSTMCFCSFLFCVFFLRDFSENEKTESLPFSGNTQTGFWNLLLVQGKRMFTNPQKWTPHGHVAGLQGKPYFRTPDCLCVRCRSFRGCLPSDVHFGTSLGHGQKSAQNDPPNVNFGTILGHSLSFTRKT